MKVGDLVKYSRHAPSTFYEFFNNDLTYEDYGFVVDIMANKTTVRVKWFRSDQAFWMGKDRLEVVKTT